MNSSKYITYIKQLLFFAVLISAVVLFTYKSSLARKQKSTTKILLFINSLVINDLSLRYDTLSIPLKRIHVTIVTQSLFF